MKNFICRFSFFFLLLITSSSRAQGLRGLSVESTFHLGKIVKHTDDINYDINRLSTGLGLNFKLQTYGKKSWHELQRYPQFGIELLYFNLGEKEILGNAFGIYQNITAYISKGSKFNSFFQVSTGLAYLTQKYDRLNNPINNAIGSNWNTSIYLKLGFEYMINKSWIARVGGSFVHFSNGGSRLPNFGINIPSVIMGLTYTPQRLESSDYIFHGESKAVAKKWGLRSYFGMAFSEYKVISGPRYPIYITSLAAMYHLNKLNRVVAGLSYEYHKAIYNFGNDVFAFNSDQEAFRGASRLSIFAGHEFLFGNWGLYLTSGFYVGDFSYLLPYPFYFRISTQYYFPPIGKPQTRFFVGLYLKSHLFRAEYIGLGAGATF